MFIGTNFHTAYFEDFSALRYQYINDEGTFQLGSLDIKSKSVVKLGADAILNGSLGQLDMRLEAVMSAETISLNVITANVEAGARITVSVADRPDDREDDETGQGVSGVHCTGNSSGYC